MAASAESYADLTGKTVVITGASSGVGRAAAVAFAAEGANVVVTARRVERLAALCEEIGPPAVFYPGDAAREETAAACVALAMREFGRVDVLINNAGIGKYKDLVDFSAAEYDELMDSNVRSGFCFARAVVPHMIAAKSGVILFVSSVAGLVGAAGESVYCASKFAQVGMAQALDAELRGHGIKVGAICPGGVKSEFALGHGRTEESTRASTMMEPDEVAAALVFACKLPPNVRIPQMTVRHMG